MEEPAYVDWCLHWDKWGESSCGKPAALALCAKAGFTQASDFDWEWASGKSTYVIAEKVTRFGQDEPRKLLARVKCFN